MKGTQRRLVCPQCAKVFFAWRLCVTGWQGMRQQKSTTAQHSSHGILFQRQMLLASLLGIFDSAELEHTAWILFGRNGPPTGAVSQEPFEV